MGGNGSKQEGGGDVLFSAEFEHTTSMENFDFIKPLARGGFGEVFLVRDRNSGKTYALKLMDKAHVQEHGMVDQAMAEKAIQLQICDSPFIVNLVAAFQTTDKLAIVMDYVAGGDLFEMLKAASAFSEPRARLYAAEVACALEYLHSRSILYRDLKLENVLVDEDGHVLLCDFGLAKSMYSPEGGEQVSAGAVLETVFCGTKEYMAPEMLLSESGYGFAVDWWAFGVFLYAMITGKYPFYARTLNKLESKIVNDDVWFPPSISREAHDLIQGLLRKDPETRFSLADVKASPFFADLVWDDVVAKKYNPEYLPEVDEVLARLRAEQAAIAAASQASSSAAASGTGEGGSNASGTAGAGPRAASEGWVVNSPSEFRPSDEYEDRRAREAQTAERAIQECRKILPDEPFIAGWVIVSINKWNFEQTRVLLLTSKAMYRVKYDFNSGSAERGFDHAARTPLADIMVVQQGRLHDSRFSSITESTTKPPTLYALRIVSSSENLRRTTKARTFCPFLTPTGSVGSDLAAQEELTDTIVGTLLAARENLLGDAQLGLTPEIVSLHRETLSAVRAKPVESFAPASSTPSASPTASPSRSRTSSGAGAGMGASSHTRVRELATLLAEINSQIADTEQVLSQLQGKRNAIRSEIEALAEEQDSQGGGEGGEGGGGGGGEGE